MNAYLVLGPESSGTRLMTRILMAAGCFGDDGHTQRLDDDLTIAGGEPLVWRRSVPHSGAWPDIREMVNRLAGAGYVTQAIIMNRAWWAMLPSQVSNGHVTTETEALAHARRAYPHIYEQVWAMQIHYTVISFEGLVQYPVTTIRHMLEVLHMPEANHQQLAALYPDITDQNAKYSKDKADGD